MQSDMLPGKPESPVTEALHNAMRSGMRPLRCKIFCGYPDQVEKDMNKFFAENNISSVSRLASCGDPAIISITILY